MALFFKGDRKGFINNKKLILWRTLKQTIKI